MKKNFIVSMALTICILFCGLLIPQNTVRAEQFLTSSVLTEDDSILTAEFIKSVSWEELQNFEKIPKTKEDELCLFIISVLSNQQIDLETNEPYIFIGSGAERDDISCDSFLMKGQSIVNLFNKENPDGLKVIFLYSFEKETLQFHLMSQNRNKTNNISYLGEKAVLFNYTVLYGSSYDYGSGEIVVANRGTNPLEIVYINGISYLDAKGNILDSVYISPSELFSQTAEIPDITIPENCRFVMFHVTTESHDLGWLFPDFLTPIGDQISSF